MDIESFSSFFKDTILDNNNIAVSDFNAGFKNLYDQIIEPSDTSDYNMFIITEEDQGYPDLIAHKYLGDQNLWHYFLLSNAIDDPFKELTVGWAYGAVDYSNAKNAVDVAEESNLTAHSRTGDTITLN